MVNPPHFPVKAKRVIHLCMAGGPSQFESFDYKPELKQLDGKPFPESFTKGQQLAQLQNTMLMARGPFVEFQKHGKSGQEISDLFPHIAGIADDICIVRSMQTEQINHDPAHAFMNIGLDPQGPAEHGLVAALRPRGRDRRPARLHRAHLGGQDGGLQPVSARQWSAGFLPSKFQGIQFQSRGDAVHYVGNPDGRLPEHPAAGGRGGQPAQRHARRGPARPRDPDADRASTRWRSGCRRSVPELTDFSQRAAADRSTCTASSSPATAASPRTACWPAGWPSAGVRFIQLYHRAWDHHGDIEDGMPIAAKDVDRSGALVTRT